MKVVILANNDVGLYRFRKELIIELLKDFDVSISLPKGEYVDYFQNLGCRFIDTEIDRRGKNIFNDLKLIFKYLFLLKNEKPDVVLTYTIKPNLYGGLVCRILGLPQIANITGLGSGFQNSNLLRKLIVYLYKICLKKTNHVFFQNDESIKNFKKEGVKLNSFSVIPGSGVNTEEYLYEPISNFNTFLFMGRIMKEKGIEQYLNAAEKIKQENESIEFLVVGPYEENYASMIQEYDEKGIISYFPATDNPQEFYRKCTFFVNPSYHEGMSNTLLEASAIGRPCIASNIAGCREIISNEETGYLIKKENSDDLYEIMKNSIKLSNNIKVKMGEKARSFVEEKFDRKIVIREYLNKIYRLGGKNEKK